MTKKQRTALTAAQAEAARREAVQATELQRRLKQEFLERRAA